MTGVRTPFSCLLLTAAASLWACDSGGTSSSETEIVVDTIADTVRIRTVSGAVWAATRRLEPEVSIGVLDGEEHYLLGRVAALAVGPDERIYVTDALVNTVRVYRSDGTYDRSLGQEGSGPGEFAGLDGGLAVLSDGRVLARDPGNQRIQVFSPEGEPVDVWRLPTGLSTSDQFQVDDQDNVWSHTVLDLSKPLSEWENGYLRFSATGDSLPAQTLPVPPFERAFVEARREGTWNRSGVPFSPDQTIRVNSLGEFVHALSTEYSFDVLRGDGTVLRIQRERPPVPVHPDEAGAARRRTTRNMRRTIPDWTWNGPEVPSEKPPYRDFHVAEDGRYWVALSEPGVETDENAWEAEPGEPAPPRRWREPMAFDVFESDGTYLGRVEAPTGFRTSPAPVFRGDRVWAVTEDEYGVQRVVRFRTMDASAP